MVKLPQGKWRRNFSHKLNSRGQGVVQDPTTFQLKLGVCLYLSPWQVSAFEVCWTFVTQSEFCESIALASPGILADLSSHPRPTTESQSKGQQAVLCSTVLSYLPDLKSQKQSSAKKAYGWLMFCSYVLSQQVFKICFGELPRCGTLPSRQGFKGYDVEIYYLSFLSQDSF